MLDAETKGKKKVSDDEECSVSQGREIISFNRDAAIEDDALKC